MEGGEGGVSFVRQPFFLLNSQVILIFRLKNSLIILRAVTYVIRGMMCSREARDQPGNYWLTIFLETTTRKERMCSGNKSLRSSLWSDSQRVGIKAMVRIHVRVRILGPGLWALICLGLLNGGVGPKTMVLTMPSFFRLGRSVFPGWKNTIFLTCLSLGAGDC